MADKETKEPTEKEGSAASAETPEGSAASAETPEGSAASAETSEKKDAYDGEVFTIDDVVNKAGYGLFQKLLTMIAGLGWLADAFEVIILSLIGDMMACEWEMERWQNAVMTSVVFLGMTIGAPSFGSFADRFGRRTSLAISMLLLFVFGAASAAAPSYAWMCVLRALMGFALGGIAQGVTLSCEYYPASMRGRAGFYLSYYWTIGTVLLVCCAWLIMSKIDSWRIFVFVASCPALIVFLTMKWCPESARYYLVSNKYDKAMKTLQRLVKTNKSEMPKGRLVQRDVAERRGKVWDLLKAEMRFTTLLFWFIWLAVSMGYYGVALITPHIVTEGSLIVAAERQNKSILEDFKEPMVCRKYSTQNFIDLLWTSFAEIPGAVFFSFSVEHVSRTKFLGTTIFIEAFLMLFLMLDIKPRVAIFIILFFCRALIAGIFQLLFIMTTEAFPTTLRASAMGTGSGCARFGGLIVPYLAQVGMFARPVISMFILCAIVALSSVAAFLLPVDTRGKEMRDTV